jgi:hypothetical protein
VPIAFHEFTGGFEWLIEDEFMQRCSHVLVADETVWLVDPLDGAGVEKRIREAGRPAAVLQLLDRHNRDCASFAQRLGVPHHVVPQGTIGPFELLPIRTSRTWREVALWWPEQSVLVCGDALGTARYFRSGRERLALHPFLRWFPPRRQLGPIHPTTVLCGHGAGVFGDADEALREALRTARRRIPGQVASAVRAWRASRSS